MNHERMKAIGEVVLDSAYGCAGCDIGGNIVALWIECQDRGREHDRLTAELAALRDAMPPDPVGLLREAGRTIEKEAGGHWATRRALAAKLCAWADRLEKEVRP